eukprot:TRINITY_DN21046_c0_g1_i1.p1 TRINITY_DN21046_c0_g1~~TRINITY_DN21046_c0_g1_i1.p1  ORF type:complete len:130 (-),score=2.48 TRINITY_DN21046_c0_g1_i1:219-608(-)
MQNTSIPVRLSQGLGACKDRACERLREAALNLYRVVGLQDNHLLAAAGKIPACLSDCVGHEGPTKASAKLREAALNPDCKVRICDSSSCRCIISANPSDLGGRWEPATTGHAEPARGSLASAQDSSPAK